MIKDLIKKYYSGSCSDAEKQKIKQFFREHPEEVEQCFDQTEWEGYEADPLSSSPAAESFLQRLGMAAEQVEPENTRIVDKRSPILSGSNLKAMLAAACLCVALGFGYYYLMPYLQKGGNELNVASLHRGSAYALKENKTLVVQSFILPDSSEVHLSPGGTIKYLRSFKGTTRDIYLTGDAIFKVQKDPAKPFTVYCGEVATTAVGTVFRVKEQNDHLKVAVTLLEGKILVRSTDAKAADAKTYYLLPGNQIAYSRVEKQFSLIEEGNQKTENKAGNSPPVKLNSEIVQLEATALQSKSAAANLSITETKQAIRFNDVGLAEVLDLLAEKRGVQIVYPTNKVANIKFIGTVSDKTPIEKVLSDIAVMNDLKFAKDSLSGKFIIQ